MSSGVVQLVTNGGIDQGKRYTDQDRDAAYFLWRTSAGRSCRKVASQLSINPRTIYTWRDDHDWINRANQDDQDDYASSRIGVAAVVVNQLVPSILRAVAIRDDPNVDPRVQLDAAKWLAGLAGVSPVSKIETAVTERRTEVVDVTPDFSSMTVEQLREYEHSVRAKR